jgi:hypothetical protein
MTHAGVEEERLNLIIFKDSEMLIRALKSVRIGIEEDRIISRSQDQATCAACGKPITVGNVGNIMPGSDVFFCDDPTHLAEYVSKYYPDLKNNRLDSMLLYTQLGSLGREVDVSRILTRTITDFNSYADEYYIPQGDKVYSNTIRLDEESIGWVPTLYDHSIFGLCRERLLPFQSGIMNQPKWHKEILRRLKPYLNPTDHEGLILAYTIIKREDEWENNPENFRRMVDLRAKFEKRYGENGKRIYNMARSGFIDELIFPSIEICESDIEDEEKRKAEGRRIFYKFLNLNPMNVYVNEENIDQGFLNEITLRLVKMNEPIVRIYARGKNWNRVASICQEYVKNHENCALHLEPYILFGAPSGCCRIWKKKLGDWTEIERIRELEELQKIDTGEITAFEIGLDDLDEVINMDYLRNLCLSNGMSSSDADTFIKSNSTIISDFLRKEGFELTEEAILLVFKILVDCMQRTDRVMRQYDVPREASHYGG